MKILAIEKEVPGVKDADYTPHLKAEAARAWELHQQGIIRELYFRADEPSAILILECPTVEEAQGVLSTLPLVKNKLIDFELIPLAPYPGFARLFGGD
jgi:muconolactone delta-isomerase